MRYTVSMWSANENGLLFEQNTDEETAIGFATLEEALHCIRTTNCGWYWNDDCQFVRTPVGWFYVIDTALGQHWKIDTNGNDLKF